MQDGRLRRVPRRAPRAHRGRQRRRPADPETEVGPLVNERRDGGRARRDRAGPRRGRHACSRAASAATTRPTSSRRRVFEGVADDALLSCEEVFGPVTSLYRFATLDEAIERANAVAFGLSAVDLHARPPRGAALRRASSRPGILHVNSQTAGADVHVPFGGIKGSGFGPHEQGRAALEFYTEIVTVYQDAPLGL